MELHTANVVALVPARLKSTRFPNKLLKEFNGKPIIWWSLNIALRLNFASNVVVLTPDKKLIEYASSFPGVEVAEIDGRSGIEKAYLYYCENKSYDYYITIPADEPAINPSEINKAWPYIKDKLDLYNFDVVTLYTKFYSFDDLKSNLSCKLVTNRRDRILYFSRNIIPATKSGELLPLEEYKKHVGVFAFSKSSFVKLGTQFWWGWNSEVEKIEGLEQNKLIDYGALVAGVEIKHIGFGIDVPAQLKQLEERIKNVNS